jgi:plastocyanin
MWHGRKTSRLIAATGLVVLLASRQAGADTLVIEVLDRNSQALADVAVYAVPGDMVPDAPGEPPLAVMDQVDLQFMPHVLVVKTGTLIEFPNSDSVNHHVYSFSPAKAFELPLYKGDVHAPLSFDSPGVVTLGCNIHDSMLGYILVVDTPYFTRTDRDGRAKFAQLPDGQYVVRVWTPRARGESAPAEQAVSLADGKDDRLVFRFPEKLFPSQEHGSSLTWSEY